MYIPHFGFLSIGWGSCFWRTLSSRGKERERKKKKIQKWGEGDAAKGSVHRLLGEHHGLHRLSATKHIVHGKKGLDIIIRTIDY
uniref:Uncharacterized protein n=1 Tax=Nelumbo nucifera TaxID=4432 RepID=A0A822ZMQ0_NELNU|nr:TPA_asm: hypothetical protein HUJ06_004283 [Nelumbo nucifera]